MKVRGKENGEFFCARKEREGESKVRKKPIKRRLGADLILRLNVLKRQRMK